ncbi:hypothetical protein [Paenibacillus borealis]|uniref:Uncharacterized protein n=1 Tax=Paenibacillus borealis TaxID=160799 RepID=A0A089LHD0_PAEBO|nr:hypothetical protein [Paenibacillus borealis]AIQ59495.1 hypothetical protein PBOR_23030 [Paenibacillus borealis]
MGVLARIMHSFDEIEEQLEYFIYNNSAIEALEEPQDYQYGEAGFWSKPQPHQAHMQKHVLADYLRLTALCSQMLVNVKSGQYHNFERSTAIVLNHIRQNTLLPESTLEDVFSEIKLEMDIQRGIIAGTYQ